MSEVLRVLLHRTTPAVLETNPPSRFDEVVVRTNDYLYLNNTYDL